MTSSWFMIARENMSNFIASAVPADGLPTWRTMTSACKIMEMFWHGIYRGPIRYAEQIRNPFWYCICIFRYESSRVSFILDHCNYWIGKNCPLFIASVISGCVSRWLILNATVILHYCFLIRIVISCFLCVFFICTYICVVLDIISHDKVLYLNMFY